MSRPTNALSRALLLVVATWSATLVVPAGAGAVDVARIFAGPITAESSCNPEASGATLALQAADYNDFCFALRTTWKTPAKGDDLSTTTIDSPTGVLADVDLAPQCDVAKFAAKSTKPATCAANTQVGESTAGIRAELSGLEIPLKLHGRVFNLTHSTDEVGLLGIQLDPTLAGVDLPKSKILLRFTLRPSPDVGLRGVTKDLPRFADTGLGMQLPIAIDTFSFRFWGSKLDHPTMPVSFSRIGSSCDEAVTAFTAESYEGVHSARTSSYRPTGCDQLTINQTAAVRTSERRPDVPTETQVEVLPVAPEDSARHATVNPGKSVVTLPPGVMLGAQGASGEGGLPLCSNAGFAHHSNVAPDCPPLSAVGTVKFTSPNLKIPFVGKAYLGAQTGPNRLPQLMISTDQGGTEPDAPRVKLIGQLTIDPQGRLVTTLTDLPDVPFSSFLLTFRGGDHGVTSTPRSCGTGTGQSVLIPPSAATPPSEAPLSLTIDQDCIDPAAFAPTLAASFRTTAAGAEGVPTVLIERPDRTARLGRTTVHLPPGMLASLKGVPECPATVAAQGACPDASRVGSVVVKAGVGPAPTQTRAGAVYLTERPAGAIAGLSIVASAAFGEVNLGELIVPARIDLRPTDLGLDLTTDVPATFLGIPLNLRSMAVTLDRPGFSKNPTSCAPLSVSADLGSDLGGLAGPLAGIQMTDCGALPFSPQIQATVPKGTKLGDAAGVTVKVGLPGNQSALKRVRVLLPTGIGADLARIKRACPVAEFRATGCAASALTGTVEGALSILDEPITGRVVMITFPGETLPGIGLDLTGRFNARIEGHVKVDQGSGQLAVTLDGLPDAPITDLTMTLPPGNLSVLKVSKLFCPKGVARFAFDLAGQNGATTARTIDAPCGNTALLAAKTHRAALSLKLRGRKTTKPSLLLRASGPAETKLRSVSITVPKGFTLNRSAVAKSFVSKARLKATSGRTIRVTLRGTGRRTLKLQLGNGTFSLLPRVRRSSSQLTYQVTLRYSDGIVEKRTLRKR